MLQEKQKTMKHVSQLEESSWFFYDLRQKSQNIHIFTCHRIKKVVYINYQRYIGYTNIYQFVNTVFHVMYEEENV